MKKMFLTITAAVLGSGVAATAESPAAFKLTPLSPIEMNASIAAFSASGTFVSSAAPAGTGFADSIYSLTLPDGTTRILDALQRKAPIATAVSAVNARGDIVGSLINLEKGSASTESQFLLPSGATSVTILNELLPAPIPNPNGETEKETFFQTTINDAGDVLVAQSSGLFSRTLSLQLTLIRNGRATALLNQTFTSRHKWDATDVAMLDNLGNVYLSATAARAGSDKITVLECRGTLSAGVTCGVGATRSRGADSPQIAALVNGRTAKYRESAISIDGALRGEGTASYKVPRGRDPILPVSLDDNGNAALLAFGKQRRPYLLLTPTNGRKLVSYTCDFGGLTKKSVIAPLFSLRNDGKLVVSVYSTDGTTDSWRILLAAPGQPLAGEPGCTKNM